MKKKHLLSLNILFMLLLSSCGKKEVYVVSFNSDGGTFISGATVNKGEKVEKPEDPVKEGYTFKEWKKGDMAYDFSSPVNESFTLTAVYEEAIPEEKPRTVTVDDGKETKTVTFEAGEKIVLTDPQSSNGHTFLYWTVDGEQTDPDKAIDGSVIKAVFDSSKHCTDILLEHKLFYTMDTTGKWQLFGITLVPADTDDPLTFTSDDPTIVTVDNNGYVKGGKAGKTKIHIKCGSVEKTVDFETRVALKSIKLDKTDVLMNLYHENCFIIKATPEPADANNKKLIYTSNNPAVAKVDSNGQIDAVGVGLTSITVSSEDKKVKAVCNVCVEGEKVNFKYPANATIHDNSGEKVEVSATHQAVYDFGLNEWDVTNYLGAEFSPEGYISIGYGKIYQNKAVTEDTTIQVKLVYSDGSSFTERSETFNITIVK